MAFRDDLFRLGAAGLRLGRTAAATGVSSATAWAEGQVNNARMASVDERLEKAAKAAKAAGNNGNHDPRDAKGIRFDPFDLVAAMGYRERPTAMTFAAMETVATKVPIVADVIRTRTNQVCTFATPQQDRHSAGFAVRLRADGGLSRKPSTKAEIKRAGELTQLICNCGYPDPDKDPFDNLPLLDFIKMGTRDSLAFDQWTFEKVPDRSGRLSYIATVDPTTIRLVDRSLQRPGGPFAVQVVQGSVVQDFQRDELAFCRRNPRSGIRAYDYGQSEIETLIREITGMLWGMEYNRKMFTQGSATKGILNFKGTIPDRHLQAFRRQWYSMVAGVENAWRTPITNAEELQWINLQMSNRDMEYSAWMDFLIKITCARFQIAPEEVNFSYGNAGQSQAMGTAPIEEKLKASKDLGLRPLVEFIFNCLNRHLLWEIDEDYIVLPVGLDSNSAATEADLLDKKGKAWMTIDEIRGVDGLEPLGEDGGGNVIRDPQWIQWMQSQQGMDEEGEFGEDEDFDGESPFEVDDHDGDEEDEDLTTKSDKPRRRRARRVVRYETNIG